MNCTQMMWVWLCLSTAALTACGQAWKPADGPLTTRWTKDVSPKNAWPEYPRPQMQREKWTNLNGLWDYAIVAKDADQPAQWDGKILVPFCAESQLSGVMKPVKPDQALWYHRTFKSPAKDDQRLLLHFGAVDWETTVWVNGNQIGQHRGGYDPFSFDITDALKPGENELVVRVWDPTTSGYQPRGKQVLKPGGIWYTAVTGIWQTAWLEPVANTHVRSFRITPDVDSSAVSIALRLSTSGGEVSTDIAIIDGRKTIQSSSITINPASGQLASPTVKMLVPNVKLWSPDSPHLYDLKITVKQNGKVVDEVDSYFGMRKIELKKDEQGINRLCLNGKPLFQFGPLDQGWWPDGLYTPPCDEALKYDIEVLKKLGMNMCRKHVKVAHGRFFYWADKMGLLIWQDMPSGDKYIHGNMPDITRDEESAENFERELKAMIDTHYNHPSIVHWVAYNEGWGQWDTGRICDLIKKHDPTRLVIGASGWTDRQTGDIHDIHRYPGPGIAPLEDKRAVVLGEFGGLGLPLPGHTWQDKKNWGYRSFKTREDLTDAYVGLLHKLHPLIGQGLCAAVYTQTSDVEIEVNGLMTYDRAMVKMDIDQARKAADRLYMPPPTINTVVPTSQDKPQTWRYTTTPPADDWYKADFDDSNWQSGPGGFGTNSTPGATVGTKWDGNDIWIRRAFTLDNTDGDIELSIHHDEDAQVYINGIPAATLKGYTRSYETATISAEARKALKKGGNVIAIHCKQTDGGQFIDAGLVQVVYP